MKTKWKRLNIEMSEHARKNLEALRDATGAKSMAEVIGRALAVYESLWDSKIRGCKVIRTNPEGTETEIFLF